MAVGEIYDVVAPGGGTPDADALAREVLHGLWSRPRRLPARLFYDEAGSALFRRITELPAYYLTRRELAVLRAHAADIAAHAPEGPLDVVELGAGADPEKSLALLRALAGGGRPLTFRPVDIDAGAMAPLAAAVARELPAVSFRGVVGDFVDGVRWLGRAEGRRRLVLFLGANAGNFSPAETRRLLRDIWLGLRPGDLMLVGFDLKKDPARLQAAYDDPEGVTRAFNLNLLRRLNRELGADFDLDLWDHHAAYDPVAGAMQSYLIAVEPQEVRVAGLGLRVRFAGGEAIHVESSHKHAPGEIRALAAASGFEQVAAYTDAEGDFCDALWRARGWPVAAGEEGVCDGEEG